MLTKLAKFFIRMKANMATGHCTSSSGGVNGHCESTSTVVRGHCS